jgi:hypothetical protein
LARRAARPPDSADPERLRSFRSISWRRLPGNRLAPRAIAVQVPPLPWAIPWSAAEAAALRALLHVIHFYGFFLLVIAVIQHLVAVITTELREGGDLVSAMLTGWKSFPGRPEDEKASGTAQRKRGRCRQ